MGGATTSPHEEPREGGVLVTWLGWAIVGLYALTAFVIVAQVGKPKQPSTPLGAAFGVVYAALVVIGLLTVGTGSGL